MKHLTPVEFVDYADGTLARSRVQHVEVCESCREQAGSMRDIARIARQDAPQPSPLFWDLFPRRVQQAIEHDPPAVPAWRHPVAALAWSLAAVALTVVAIRAPHRLISPPSPGAATVAAHADGDVIAGQDDAAWQVLTEAAADLKLDEAHEAGLGVPAATIDKAVLELSPAEREELGRLLQDERRRAGI